MICFVTSIHFPASSTGHFRELETWLSQKKASKEKEEGVAKISRDIAVKAGNAGSLSRGILTSRQVKHLNNIYRTGEIAAVRLRRGPPPGRVNRFTLDARFSAEIRLGRSPFQKLVKKSPNDIVRRRYSIHP